MAGVAHGSQEKVLWKGDLPMIPSLPGMRFTLFTPGDEVPEAVNAFTFRQVTLEINTKTNEFEQVIYVANVDRSAKELTE